MNRARVWREIAVGAAVGLSLMAPLYVRAGLANAMPSPAPTPPSIEQCTHQNPCYNGHTPSYADPDCWPGAIWCPPAGSQPDRSLDDDWADSYGESE